MLQILRNQKRKRIEQKKILCHNQTEIRKVSVIGIKAEETKTKTKTKKQNKTKHIQPKSNFHFGKTIINPYTTAHNGGILCNIGHVEFGFKCKVLQ